METQYTIQIDLPLPPSYSNISQEEYKVASKLRNKIQKKFGINIVLTGKMCFNPNYKVKNTWNNPEEPQTIIDQIQSEFGTKSYLITYPQPYPTLISQ